MNRDAEPEWADKYGSVRRHGDVIPVPSDWILRTADGDAIRWGRYAGVAEGLTTRYDVLDSCDDLEPGDADASASLTWEQLASHQTDQTLAYTVTIAGNRVFRRVEPDWDDLLAAVGETLKRYAYGGDWQSVAPDTGRPHPEDRRASEIAQRRAQNMSLRTFGDGGEGQ